MDYSAADFLTVDEIISDVTASVNDREFSLMSKGYYVSTIQSCLQELAYDTLFDVRYESIPINGSTRIDMPKGAFNIRNMWVFNGDNCGMNDSQKVWYKRNYYTNGNGGISNNTGKGGDMFFKHVHVPGNLLFGNVQNGIIMLSQSCTGYEKLFIEFNGVGCDIGETPSIPMHLRRAVTLWSKMQILEIKMAQAAGTAEFPHWSKMRDNTYTELYGRRGTEDSVWSDAQTRVKRMSKHKANDLKEYFTRMNS